MAGFMVENLALGLVSQYRWDEVAKLPRDGSVQLIDIRTPAEFERGALPGFRNIPLDELRERLNELDPALPVRLVCQSGLRSYVAARMLAGHGFAGVSHLAGACASMTSSRAMRASSNAPPPAAPTPVRSVRNLPYPSATSSTIMSTKPKATPMVPMLVWRPCWVWGMSSSVTTYIMAPAAKANT